MVSTTVDHPDPPTTPWRDSLTRLRRAGPVLVLSLVIGFAALYLPTYLTLAERVWSTDEQGHGPIILVVGIYLIGAALREEQRRAGPASTAIGIVVLVVGLLAYLVGRSQYALSLEVLSQNLVLLALILVLFGSGAARRVAFPLFFLLFMVPLPGSLVASLTSPLKSLVSAVASNLLHLAGFPVGRAGVLLTIGPYQLLVADACAGLNSMFTLEALGLLYMHLRSGGTRLGNIVLTVLIVPIAFGANVVRVMTLVLVTYFFGDEAGQGFVHGFAGLTLFLVGLMIMLAVDNLLIRTVFRAPVPTP